MKKKLLVSICARGGSKGVPNKNIKVINGKPLIAYSIDAANRLTDYFDIKIGLSTDDFKIKEVAESLGVKTDYMRPDYLATDTAGKLDAIKDLYEYHRDQGFDADYVLDLDVSSPLRTHEDLLNAFKLFEEDSELINTFSVNTAHKNPYFNMVELKQDGYVELSKKLPGLVKSRQQAPQVFEMNASFYYFRKDYFQNNYHGVFTPKTKAFVMDHMCFDIDEPLDFEFMDFLLSNNKLNFEI